MQTTVRVYEGESSIGAIGSTPDYVNSARRRTITVTVHEDIKGGKGGKIIAQIEYPVDLMENKSYYDIAVEIRAVIDKQLAV